jgi:flagellar M-ring protein FliF
LIIASVATVAVLASLIWFATRPAYKVLFSGLPEEETARVVEELEKMRVPYELGLNNSTVRIPQDRVHDVRLDLASLGMPKKSGGVGFEIFEQTNLVGMTDQLFQVNRLRALQGELARTIQSVAAVNKARVHLVLPKRSLFISEEREASASVVMELSKSLSPSQIQGIVHLISASVEGLDENKVTLLDQKGNLIAGGKKEDPDGRLQVDEGMALQRRVEHSLEEGVQAILSRVVGPDKSVIRITADLDLSRVERQEELFDPEGQVPRSEQFVNENSKGTFGIGGVPGVQPNDPNASATAAAGASGSDQKRNMERETVNYEISKTTNRVLLPVGTIKRLSVAVLVDGRYEAAEEAGKPPVFKDRAPEELAKIQKLVEHAVGFRTDRGDTIEVTSAPFVPLEMPVEEVDLWKQPEFQLEVAKIIGLALLVILLIFTVLRPMIKKLLVPEKGDPDQLPSSVAELEQALIAEGVGSTPAEPPSRLFIPDRNLTLSQQMISEHVEEARDIIRGWMTQDG